jgi:electron transport complex protein RnfB
MLVIGLFLIALAVSIAAALSSTTAPTRHTGSWTIDRIDALLPQTQCTACGYGGCRPYAKAILDGEAKINQCPPGGDATIKSIADLLGHDHIPLDPARGPERAAQVVVIDEQVCIGCTKCIEVCPVDAIIGARKLMHTVIAERCTGCELCIPPCPVDCIDVLSPAQSVDTWKWPAPAGRNASPHSELRIG